MRRTQLFVNLGLLVGLARSQNTSGWPHDYPGKPQGNIDPMWQKYFEVTHPLPNVTFAVGRSYAGNIPVDRPGHPNDTLFFWAFEKFHGSLTAERSQEPWGIWLNGGPGSSSMIGLFSENGPVHIASNGSLHGNKFAWNNLADYIWVDQPVGVGFSTADSAGFALDEDQIGLDFMIFLSNLVKVFPSLKTRPLYLTGESYAGRYIPYITKTYFSMQDPPVNLKKIAIGDGAIGNSVAFVVPGTLQVIETYPQVISYDTEVYEYFKDQFNLCGYNLRLTYPQNGHFPTLNPPFPGTSSSASRSGFVKRAHFRRALTEDVFTRHSHPHANAHHGISEEQLLRRDTWKRDLTGRANGTIDPWYQCDIFDEMIDYALNFSLPWRGHSHAGFDIYNVPDALLPEAPMPIAEFLNDNRTRAAIHAPMSKNWSQRISYPFGGDPDIYAYGDPSIEPMAFLDEFAANATERGVHIVIYSGNDDALVPHLTSEIVIQNTTFGGIQGFTRRPSTPWYGNDGSFAGIIHQERNWTYVLFQGAGHMVPSQQPEHAFVFLRDFVLGGKMTGLVATINGTTTVVGGENATLAANVLPGQPGIYIGSATTQSTYTYPSATIAAWSKYMASITSGLPTTTPGQ